MTGAEAARVLARLAARLEDSTDQEAVLYALYVLHRMGCTAEDAAEPVIYLPPRLRRKTDAA